MPAGRWLIGKGYEVVIHDECVNLGRLIGANREYVEKALPAYRVAPQP